ncbi:MAG: virulence-associated E family protein [Gordonibacter sp.]|uniref:virulence-associated E family protein n=1 Tax=Gordonibacter sp. TaxID=1968902 RepID=UPI002FC7BD4D
MSDELEQWKAESIAIADAEQYVDISLMMTKQGTPLQSIENCIRAPEQDRCLTNRFRLNVLSNAIDITLPLPWDDGIGTRQMTDADVIELAAYFEQAHDLRQKKKASDALIAVSQRNAWNPVKERFEKLSEWDGSNRAGHLFSWFLGAHDNDYTQAVERLFLSGGIIRTYHPGTKFDYMPVLVGGQGIGKSTLARKMALDGDWFTDGVMGIGTKEAAEIVQGNLIIEVAELDALKGRNLETTKAFISRTSDDYRASYGTHVERHPRRFVLIGTTNANRFLTDATGNRRFLPIKCGEVSPMLDLFSTEAEVIIEQAWAEMLHLYRQEGKLSLVPPRSIEQAVANMQSEAAMDDPRIGEIEAWLDDRSHGERVCAAEIAEDALNIPRPQKRYEIDDVHGIMERCFPDWEKLPKKCRIGSYGVQLAYQKPAAWVNDSNTGNAQQHYQQHAN